MKFNQLIQFIDFCSRILHRLCVGTLGAILQGTVVGAAVGESSTELTVAAKRGEARGRSIPWHFLSKVVGKSLSLRNPPEAQVAEARTFW